MDCTKISTNNKDFPGGIVLFAKAPGKTSFSSLFVIKHALHTKKVGHTGTLDSFAQGLLVVMIGSHTRLAQRVTSFDKTYEAILKFGSETDTLDPVGQVIKTSPLPTKKTVIAALAQFTGTSMQAPPSFSAVHVNGKRASDLARAGKEFEIPKRPITVYSQEILEIKYAPSDASLEIIENNRSVEFVKVRFHVSKGTYIRCLARDIGEAANSTAHLVGLLRTSVGFFKLKDAAGARFLASFTIDQVCKDLEKFCQEDKTAELPQEDELQQEVVKKLHSMDNELAKECGFSVLTLKSESEFSFFNGKPLRKNFFASEVIEDTDKNIPCAVFCEDGFFSGVIEQTKNDKTPFKYGFVIRRED